MEVFERILELNEEGCASHERINLLLERVKEESNSENDDEADRLMAKVKEILSSGVYLQRMCSSTGDQRCAVGNLRTVFDIRICLAEAHEANGAWNKAQAIYKQCVIESFNEEKQQLVATGSQTRIFFCGASARRV